MSSSHHQQQLRRKFRLRRWHVTFGNPALGTYGGNVVSLHHRSRRNALAVDESDNLDAVDRNNEQDENSSDDDRSTSSSSSCDSFSSCSSFDSDDDVDSERIKHNKSQTDDMERIVVMTNVPPHQVPDGVINLVRSHRPFIEQVRIVIGLSPAEEAELRRKRRMKRNAKPTGNNIMTDATIKQDSRRGSLTWACENEDDTSHVNCSLATSLSATSITNLEQRDTLKSNNDQVTRGTRSSSLDELALKQRDSGHERSSCFEFILEENKDSSDQGNDNKSYHILFVLDSKDSAETFVSDLHHRPYTSLDETETCSVYHIIHVEGENGVSLLGPLFASSTSPPSPSNQSLAATTSSKQQPNKDDHQCPVCLDKMSLDAKSSILTTVCNHSFHIGCLAQWQDSPCPVCRFDHSGLNETLSRCHLCFNTVGNYVCLICGVISCAKGPPGSSHHDMIMEGSSSAQIPSQRGHAVQHYEETLHAYALDTETQHVFDFAGGGYVHRLLQNIEDGKIVEGTDPRVVEEAQIEQLLGRSNSEEVGMPPLSSLERSTIPTYSSSAEDDEAIHRKLEGFAGQYYTLLKSQLEQQRIYYEGRLEAIRREYEDNTKAEQSTSDLISALKQQRHQLEQRCMTLKKKNKKLSDDAMFLKNMNETLEADKFAFRDQIADAQAELARAKELKKERLAPLEKKVNLLMLQLESGFDSKPAAKPPDF
jgi:BRCA1-associated protein